MKTVIVGMGILAATAASAVELSNDWRIVVPTHAAPVVAYAHQKAAELLKRDLAEGAGLALEIVKSKPATGPAIYLGADAAKAAGVATDDLVWYDNAIVEKDGNLYLFGNDRARSTATPRRAWSQAQLPTVAATVRFLHDYLGDRFCLPGETGRYVGHRAKVVVPDGTRVVVRPTQIFGSSYSDDMFYSYAAGLCGAGLFHNYGGHSYPVAVPVKEYATTHPEYFGLSSDGIRTGLAYGSHAARCISNPEVEELMIAELLKRYDAGAEVCQLAQQDGDEVCRCENCRALYGTGDDWGEKFWCFHKHLAERIEKLRPGKIVHIISYARTEKPPKTFKKFPSNVMIEMARYTEADFKAWQEYDVPQGFTLYTYFWGMYQQAGLVARHSYAFLAMMARRFLRNNVKGIYRCGCCPWYGLEGPAAYVFNEVLANPEARVDELVAEYCKTMFGAASSPMQRFYDVQDARLRGYDLIQLGFADTCGNGLERYCAATTKMNGDLHAWMYSPDTVKTMEEALQAAEMTPGLSDKEKRRLDLVRREFNYAKAMGEIAYLYGAYKFRPTHAAFDALAEALDARQQAVLGLSDGKGGAIQLPGWPELQVMGGGGYFGGPHWIHQNGHLGGAMGAPLNWDTKRLKERGVLPGATMAEKGAVRVTELPTLAALVTATGAWAAAQPTKLTGVQGEENLPESTEFRLAYDAKNLYVGIKTDLPETFEVMAFGRDDKVWETECLDLFIAPAKSVDIHYHLLWSALPGSGSDFASGLITEPLDPLYGRPDIRWNGSWTHEDCRADNVWYSVITIPFADFGVAPQKGDVWRFNLGRATNPEQKRAGSRAYIWSQNLFNRRLDYPDAMGRIVFK